MICSICIATYKRPQLLDRLLRSIEAQVLSANLILDVIVVDNDRDGSGAPAVVRHADTDQVTFRYFHQPVKNISLTRNTAVAHARGEYMFFVDDDEVAAADWVRVMLEAAIRYRAEAVFGPVLPVFDDDAPGWIRKGQRLFMDTIPPSVTGSEATAMWTGNCVVNASVLRSVPGPFDPWYGDTGGEDTELFNRLRRRGVRAVYCNEAQVFEYWPSSRTRLSYLLKRGLKGGNAHTRRMIAFADNKTRVRLLMFAKAVTFGFTSLLLSVATLPSKVWRTYWQMKLAANVGRLMAAVGQNYRSYN